MEDDEISSSQFLTEEEFLNSDFTPFTQQSLLEPDHEEEEVRKQEPQN